MDFSKYKNNAFYPSKDDYKKVYLYSKGKLIATKNYNDLTHEDKNYTQEVEFDEEGFNKQRKFYDDEDEKIYQAFKEDSLKDVGLFNHPKADQIYAYAWEKGHSCGFSKVYNELYAMSYLFLD